MTSAADDIVYHPKQVSVVMSTALPLQVTKADVDGGNGNLTSGVQLRQIYLAVMVLKIGPGGELALWGDQRREGGSFHEEFPI